MVKWLTVQEGLPPIRLCRAYEEWQFGGSPRGDDERGTVLVLSFHVSPASATKRRVMLVICRLVLAFGRIVLRGCVWLTDPKVLPKTHQHQKYFVNLHQSA